jgi:hypothetical protein
MKKTLIEAQPAEIKEPQDFILTQNPEIRSLLDRDMRAIDVMTFPRLAQEIKIGVTFLQTLIQDNLSMALDENRNTEDLWEKTEEVASEELKNRDPYRKIAEKYKAIVKYLLVSFAARNIENQFLANVNEKSLAIVEDTKHTEIINAQFQAYKEFYEKSMASRDAERADFKSFAETMATTIKEASGESMKTAVDMFLRMQGQQPTNNNQVPVESPRPQKQIKIVKPAERPVFHTKDQKLVPEDPQDITFPSSWSSDDRVIYLLTTFPNINKRRVQRITNVPDNIYTQLYNMLRRQGAITKRGRKPAGPTEEPVEETEEDMGEEEEVSDEETEEEVDETKV